MSAIRFPSVEDAQSGMDGRGMDPNPVDASKGAERVVLN
ncbi:hypothetical protein B0G77_1061 [Paraburkholderia sp. BL10I2N1]|nr:hypothetical protein B0G77_1061 [Paraburkholderia sp. BL10I2N1]